MQPAAGAYPRVGIVVVAYNAGSTLVKTLERIPPVVSRRVAEVIISDDASHDDTFDLGRSWAIRGPTHQTPTCSGTPRTSGTEGIKRPPTDLPSSTVWTSSFCYTATGSTRPKAFPTCSRRSRARTATPFSGPG